MFKLADLKRELLARPFADPTLPPHLRARREALLSGRRASGALGLERKLQGQANTTFQAPPDVQRTLQAEMRHRAKGARSMAEAQAEVGQDYKGDYRTGTRSSPVKNNRPITPPTNRQQRITELSNRNRSALETRARRHTMEEAMRAPQPTPMKPSALTPHSTRWDPAATTGHAPGVGVARSPIQNYSEQQRMLKAYAKPGKVVSRSQYLGGIKPTVALKKPGLLKRIGGLLRRAA